MKDGNPSMSDVWFGGLAGHGYPQQEIFLLDAGYGGHEKNWWILEPNTPYEPDGRVGTAPVCKTAPACCKHAPYLPDRAAPGTG